MLVVKYDKKRLGTKDVANRQTAINYGCEALASIPEDDFCRLGFFTALIAMPILMQQNVIFSSSTPPELVELEAAISFMEVALELKVACYVTSYFPLTLVLFVVLFVILILKCNF